MTRQEDASAAPAAGPGSTLRATIVRGDPDPLGWRALQSAPGQPHVVREDLGPVPDPSTARAVLALAHLSDLHVMDAQSPARLEHLDRMADPDSPVRDRFPTVGTYRAHETLSHTVVEAMVQSINAAGAGPVTGRGLDLAVVTGDSTDNCQRNELDTYLGLLEGRRVEPDSGDPTRYEGVAADTATGYDVRYWHPHGTPTGCADDLPRSAHGFPVVPGLLDAAREAYQATGLDIEWYAAHGNHDRLLQGVTVPDPGLVELATGTWRVDGLPDDQGVLDAWLEQMGPGVGQIGPGGYPPREAAPGTPVTADQRRRFTSRREFVDAHFSPTARPPGHGFTAQNRTTGTAYHATDLVSEGPVVRLLMLDTVNEHGGWQGSLDGEQHRWLIDQLQAGSRRYLDEHARLVTQEVPDVLFIVAGHHTLETMINPYAPPGQPPRVLGAQLTEELLRYPNVVLMLTGHTHRHAVTGYARPASSPVPGGFWQVTTASHIDDPQQSRIVEIAIAEDRLLIAATVLDHLGPVVYDGGKDPVSLAGLSRVLAANDWQRRDWAEFLPDQAPDGRGSVIDRNVLLSVPLPFPMG